MTAAPAPLVVFGSLWFGYYALIGLFNPYAPLWFKELGFSTLAIGAIASLQSWTRIVAPYGWAWLGDHGGERVRLVRLASVAVVLAALGLLFARGFGPIAACTVLLFLANGAIVPLSEATLASHLNSARGLDTKRYGRIRVWGSIGFIASVLAAGALLQALGIGLFPWLVLLASVLLLGATLRLPGQRDDVSGRAQAPAVLAVLRRPEVAWFFASVFFTVLGHTSVYGFLSLYLDALGYARSTVGALWAAAIAIEIVFFWFQGRFFSSHGGSSEPYRWLQAAALAAALRFGATAAFGSSLAVLVAAQLLHALTFAAQHAACIVVINQHFAGPLRGRGQALYTVLGYGIPGVIGGFGGGWLSTRYGYPAVFWAGAAAALLGLAAARIAPAMRR